MAGARFPIAAVPRDTRRYIRLYYTVVGSDPTTGTIMAGCGVGGVHQDNLTFPDAVVS